MSNWPNEQLDRIGASDELEITTRRGDGSLRPWVPIWVVRVGDDLYVRSYRGIDGAWFRHATASGTARIRAGGLERDVILAEPVEASVHEQVDSGYQGKYGRYGGSYVTRMTSPAAIATTVRLIPA
ncbi:DUF2255 family protein [Actinopolymorpha rutila]|uniref:DUF2255 family protein n=1 Tax=Actinopolymorpha rutila TaxID=446787 RepID=A0A852ZHH6_9ACTN|nr:DUF2255 family protein [Actinopolymorpha rutila]NYH91102.1 hypothetical protein [Actinopolymorpha rutila]